MLLGSRAIRFVALAALMASVPAFAQDSKPPATVGDIDVDFLLNYYTQDGDHSPVTGGIGTEELDVITPVIIVNWKKGDTWTYRGELTIDSITSASTDNMDLGETHVSGASRQDSRAFTAITATRDLGGQEIGLSFGLSREYDYQSVMAGASWSRGFRQENRTVAASLRHYADTVELYEIDGVKRGDDSRSTTDLSLSFTQVLGKNTVGSIEMSLSSQSGFLSTPFHEVILAPGVTYPDGQRVAERLPDSRTRTALGLRLNHAFSKRIVLRSSIRFYDDDWGVTAGTFEIEPHFRLPAKRDMWIYPILRYHSQDSSEYFWLPRTSIGYRQFITADRDLSEFTSEKVGLGWRTELGSTASGWKRRLRYFESRITNYSRDDGLDAISLSFAMGMRF